jgi:hypothetical protein
VSPSQQGLGELPGDEAQLQKQAHGTLGEYPYLAEMAATQAATSSHDEETDFPFGLDLILNGRQRALHRRS